MSHHTKNKGDLGVLKAQLNLFEQGFTICLPQTEHAPFDLVAYKQGEFRYGSNMSLRVKTPKNGQAKGVRFANDFRRVP